MKYYLKADSKEYLEYLKNQAKVSKSDVMTKPTLKHGYFRGYLVNGWQEACSKYVCEILREKISF